MIQAFPKTYFKDRLSIPYNFQVVKKGITTNEKIGQFFNMSYSAISHCVKIFKDKMDKDKKVKSQFETDNSQFKLCPLIFFGVVLLLFSAKLLHRAFL